MRARPILIAAMMAGICGSATNAKTATTAPDWSALAIADVEATYQLTVENHPGMFDPANPEFPALLEKARTEGLDHARKAKTAAGFEASLQRFKAILDDGHAGAYASLPDAHSPVIRWPGFIAAWRGDAMYVYRSEPGGPLAGSSIESCDGQPIPELVEAKVFAYQNGGNIPGDWWSSARRLFVDDGNPFIKLPRKCLFKAGAKTETRTLRWSPVPDYYQQWRNGSINGDLLPIGMAERAPGIHWIALPDFSPDEEGVAAYKTLYSDIESKMPQLMTARAVVLDLRYNGGGSSAWSKMLAERLWGKAELAAAMRKYGAKTQTWWRPTPGNLEAVKEFVPLLESQGAAETAALVKMFIPLFENAIARNEKYLVEPDFPTIEGAVAGPSAFKTPVYVVVPGQCASACLDAIDYFKRFPNTKLIGAPSSADSTYMEVRNPKLPSGMAYAIIPMKMYVDRPRGNGEYYTPDIEMRDFDWSTENFLKKIEADLMG